MIRQCISLPKNKLVKRRLAAQIVQLTERYKSRIMIEYKDRIINAKSMLGLLSLLDVESPLTLIVDGIDEKEATKALTSLIDTFLL